MRIVKTPAEILCQKARPVQKFDKKLAKLVQAMIATLAAARNPEGVGLAAPQVGIAKRIFVIQTNPNCKNATPRYQTLINPVIIARARINPSRQTSHHGAADTVLEGCLSIENVWGYTVRAPRVKLRYQDFAGREHTQTFTKFIATVVQHEIDHLNGILFTHRVLQQKGRLYKIEKDKKTKQSVLVPLNL